MTNRILFVVLLAAPAGLSAQQPTTADSATVHVAPAARPGDKIVCQTDDELGSRIAKRKTCLTVSQWREHSPEVGRSMDQRTAALGKPGGN